MTILSLTALKAIIGIALVAVVALLAIPQASAQTIAPAATTRPPVPVPPVRAQAAAPSRAEIEEIVRDYILKNPQIIQEAIAELEKRAAAEEEARRRQALAANRELLVNSPRGVVIGNPKGDVTLVEFFDYNCGFCKRALADLQELVKNDPNLRVVLKDFPVLGDSSLAAARVAIAAKMQASGPKYFEFHQKLMGGRGEATRERALAVAREVGLDMTRLSKDIDSPEVTATIEENYRLAQALGLTGTPSYVIGDDVVVGAVGASKLTEEIKETRAACKKAPC